jgi:hypothetical protein
MQFCAAVAPVAQRVARRRLDLDDVGAEIGELEREHVAGDEPRQIEHAHAGERSGGVGLERELMGPGRPGNGLDAILANMRALDPRIAYWTYRTDA